MLMLLWISRCGAGILPTWAQTKAVLPVACGLLATKGFTLMGYESISISLAHTIKSCEPIFTVFFSLVWLRRSFSRRVYLSLIPILSGAVMAANSDIQFHVVGAAAVVLATSSQSLMRLYNKELMQSPLFRLRSTQNHKSSSGAAAGGTGRRSHFAFLLRIKFATCLVATAICATISICRVIVDLSTTSQSFRITRVPIIPIVVSSMFQWYAGLCAYALLSMIAPLSHSIAKIAERMLLILISILLFQSHAVSPINMFGIILAFMGVATYVLVRAGRSKEQAAALELSSASHRRNARRSPTRDMGV